MRHLALKSPFVVQLYNVMLMRIKEERTLPGRFFVTMEYTYVMYHLLLTR